MSRTTQNAAIDLSIIIPSKNEGPNLDALLPALQEALRELDIHAEILVVDAASDDGAPDIVASHGARYLAEQGTGYGNAILTGARHALGRYILTMDADHSHPARFISDLWHARERADLIIASRYTVGGSADQPFIRLCLSKLLNAFFRIGLDLPASDLSSGFRLYHSRVFRRFEPKYTSFVMLVEVLLHALRDGRDVAEIPFQYAPRDHGVSNARVILFGIEYCRLFHQMWRIRNSCTFPDYDWRAYRSRIPLQRWWHHRRVHHILRFTAGELPLIDVGCGSSRILGMLPPGAVGVDMHLGKLRFQRRSGKPRLQADGCRLPFADATVGTIVNSQVIEHIPDEGGALLDEFARVLRPGGELIIGTPDYGRWEWRVTEWVYDRVVPDAYGQEHVNPYTFETLTSALRARGFEILDHAYIARGELIVKARKHGDPVGDIDAMAI
ncbi:MAG: glycosyltransferase [Candidatus Hydrogenedentes bacterium]|nr:glycosyltransferase [Candidatus Hydrogenedentota bacterium]